MIKSFLRRFSEEPLVLSSKHNHVYKVKINKPKALNALCIPSIEQMQTHLNTWNSDATTRVVLFEADGAKAFCAGGDVKGLYFAKQKGEISTLSEFFYKEYILDYALSRMRPLQISIYDGITMGGGLGISINSPIRIGTDSSIISMPEAVIGLYPDVGSTFFLPRLPGHIGLYLGITSSRLTGKEVVQAGLATHYIEKQNLQPFKNALIDKVTPESSIQFVEDLTKEFATDVQEPLKDIENIEKYFGNAGSVEEIFERLKDGSAWATEILKSTEKLCPLTMKIVFEQCKRGKSLSLAEAFMLEYRLSVNSMNDDEFFEGLRALLVDKDKNPKWKYSTLSSVSGSLIQSFFSLPKTFTDLNVEAELQKLKKSK